MSPSVERMMPEPSSDCLPMSVSSLTTLGTTLAATCSTEPAGRFAAGWPGAAPETVVDDGAVVGLRQRATPPPTPADTNAMARAPAVKSPVARTLLGRSRNRRAHRSGGVGGPIGIELRTVLRMLLLGGVAPVVRLLRRAGALVARRPRVIGTGTALWRR